jgi:hemoglobin-like flavoprotein
VNAQHIALIQSSFAWIAPSADVIGELFDINLCALDPSLSLLFAVEVGEQGRKLMALLRSIVRGLDRLDQLIPIVQNLGRRHAEDGVCAEHYDTVGDALMLTLEQCLGERFTPDVAVAWDKTYAALAEVMQMAAASEALTLGIAA